MVVYEILSLGFCLTFQENAFDSEEKHFLLSSGPDLVLVFWGGKAHSDTSVAWMAVSVCCFSVSGHLHLYLQICPCLLFSGLSQHKSLCCLMV